MPDIRIGDKTVKVDANTAQRVSNVVNGDSIREYLDEFWTDEKLGKHKDMKRKHGELILKNLKGDVKGLFGKLNTLDFHIKLGKTYKFKDLLERTGLDEYLSENYIKDALAVTTTRPAIGHGEFLLASIFSNIGFAKGSGDLVDLETHKAIEVKGSHSILGNGQNDRFKSLTKGLLQSVLQYANISDMDANSDLTADYVQELKKKIGPNEKALSRIFVALQNLNQEYDPLGKIAVELYKEKKHFLRIVAAEHLFAYMNIQSTDFILFHDDKRFSVFPCPNNLAGAYKIIDYLDVHGWNMGDFGIKVSLK